MERSEEETIPNDSDPLLERKNEGAEPSSQLSPPLPATVSALEIEDEETDASSAACCRICLEAESEIGDVPMCWRVQFCCVNWIALFQFFWECFCLWQIWFSDCSK